jgi:hypothetical protein
MVNTYHNQAGKRVHGLERVRYRWTALVVLGASFMLTNLAEAVGMEDVVGDWTVSVDLSGATQLARPEIRKHDRPLQVTLSSEFGTSQIEDIRAVQLARLEIRKHDGTLQATLSSEFGTSQIEDIRIEAGILALTYEAFVSHRAERVRVSLRPNDGILAGTVSTGEHEMAMEWPIKAAKIGTEAESALQSEYAAKRNANASKLPVNDSRDFLGVWELLVKRDGIDDAPEMRMGLLVIDVDGKVVVGVKAMNGPQRTIYDVSKIENGLRWNYDLNFGGTKIPFQMDILRSGENLTVTLTSGNKPPFLSGTGVKKENGDELGLEPGLVAQEPNVELIGMIDNQARVVDVQDDVVFVQEGTELTALNVINPLLVRFALGRFPDRCLVTSVEGFEACVVNWESGQIEVFDISDSTATALIGSCRVPGNLPNTVGAGGSLVYAANWNGKADTQQLHTIDVSNSTEPIVLSSYDTPKGASNYDIAVSGSHLFLASTGVLRIIDISKPQTPVLISTFQGRGSWVRGVDVADSIAYIATSMHADASWLQLVDISDPSTPVQVGIFRTAGGAQDVAVSDSTAFVADRGNGLVVVDVVDPANPRQCGYYRTTGRAHRVAVSGTLVFVEVRGPMGGKSGLAMFRYVR